MAQACLSVYGIEITYAVVYINGVDFRYGVEEIYAV
jgi:hypothetical protein